MIAFNTAILNQQQITTNGDVIEGVPYQDESQAYILQLRKRINDYLNQTW